MSREFQQLSWDESLAADWRNVLRLAIQEDLGEAGDWTTLALVPADAVGRAALVSRSPGVVAGLPAAAMTLQEIDPRLQWQPTLEDGQTVAAGQEIARIEGPAASLLTAERTVLNLLGRMCGIATLTRRYVVAISGTRARIYDTRKTTPGWRRLEKYAVRCGGGWNHRTGLYEAVLIKDNHLAVCAQITRGAVQYTPAEAVQRARQYVERHPQGGSNHAMIIEVEVDTLEQFQQVLPTRPDIILLDNMPPALLRQAVAERNRNYPALELEASGGVNLDTVRQIAESGVDRISVGALTHSAVGLDIGLDWRE